MAIWTNNTVNRNINQHYRIHLAEKHYNYDKNGGQSYLPLNFKGRKTIILRIINLVYMYGILLYFVVMDVCSLLYQDVMS